MLKFTLVLICCLTFILTSSLQAQTDPFAGGQAVDAAALSPSELPSFDEYRQAPENIKISTISPKELSSARSGREKVFVLDARNKEEFDISHISSAKRAGYDDFSVERIWMVDRKARVIVYSAAGERANTVAQYLKLMGFLDIQILEGSLIGWKNAGHEVVDNNNQKTERVHVGKKQNMKLLTSGKVVF